MTTDGRISRASAIGLAWLAVNVLVGCSASQLGFFSRLSSRASTAPTIHMNPACRTPGARTWLPRPSPPSRAAGRTPTGAWINSGVFCAAAPDFLFDPDAMIECPAPLLPEGGQSVGRVEVASPAGAQHAGLNVALVGGRYVPTLIGFAVPKLNWCSGWCPTATDVDGEYTLELVLPHLDWRASDPISGDAILSLRADQPTTIYGSGGGVIAFSYRQVGGTRDVEPVITADCGPHPLDPATPINEPLYRAGAVNDSDPNAAWLRSFLEAPETHLPPGTWDIVAHAWFSEAPGCTAADHAMESTLRITVSD